MYGFFPSLIFAWIPEVLYFTLFLVFAKGYKTRKLELFFVLLFGYVLFEEMFKMNIYFQIAYTLYVPIVLRMLYKDKFHISDIFVFVYSSIFLILISIIGIVMYSVCKFYVFSFVVNRILMFLFLFLFKTKIRKYYEWIISQWNRNVEHPNRVKAITIRQVCTISLNIMIYVLYLILQYFINFQ